MFKLQPIILLALTTLMTPTMAASRHIATCIEPKGQSFYLVPNEGWTEDGMSGARMSFFKDSDGSYDIITANNVTGTSSVHEYKATVTTLHEAPGRITLLVNYESDTVDMFQLTIGASGEGLLIYNKVVNGAAGITKGSMLTAKCHV